MPDTSVFRLDSQTDSDGAVLSPRTTVKTLVKRGVVFTTRLKGDKRNTRRVMNLGRTRFALSLPARASAQVEFLEGPRVRLTAELKASVRVRVPARRGPKDLLAVDASAGGMALLKVELALEQSWTLARALRELSQWLDPHPWVDSPSLPAGARWQLEYEIPLEAGASARLRKLQLSPMAGLPVISSLETETQLELRVARLERVQITLEAADVGKLRISLTTLDRRSRRIAGRFALAWRMRGGEALGREMLDRLWPGSSEILPEVERILRKARKLREKIDSLPLELRKLGGPVVGEGSRLQTIITRLGVIEALLDASPRNEQRRRWLRRVRNARKAAHNIQRRGEQILGRLEALTGNLLSESPLSGLIRTFDRLLAEAESLESSLPLQAGQILAEGLAVDLAASQLKTLERSAVVTAEIVPGSPGAEAALTALLAGQVILLASMAGQQGIEQVQGRWVSEWRKRRSRALRVRLGHALGSTQRTWISRFRITRSLDGAIEVLARERYTRKAVHLLRDEIASLVIDLAIVSATPRLDTTLLLTWTRSYSGARAARRLERVAQRLLAALFPEAEAPEAAGLEFNLPKGELKVSSRLDRSALIAAMRPATGGRHFAARHFWPAWASAIESGYRLMPPPALRPGRHPLRDPAVRRLLSREPNAQALRALFPRMKRLEREAVASDWFLGKAVLSGLLAVRQAAGHSRGPGTYAIAARKIIRAMDSLTEVNLVPLLALTLLVPPGVRRVDVGLSPL